MSRAYSVNNLGENIIFPPQITARAGRCGWHLTISSTGWDKTKFSRLSTSRHRKNMSLACWQQFDSVWQALLMSESDCAKARHIRMRNVFTQWLKVFTLCLIKQNSIFSNSSDLLVIALRTDIVNVLTGITGWGWNLGFVSAHLSSFLDQRMQKTDHYFFSANSPLVVIKRIKSTKGINTKKNIKIPKVLF